MHTTPHNSVPAGWYPDPWYTGQHRYWSGQRWTADVFSDLGGMGVSATSFARGYGPPPTAPADTAPPPPDWQLRTPPTPQPAPAPRPVSPTAESRNPWLIAAAVVVGLCVIVAGLLLVRPDPQNPTRTASAPTATPTPSPTPESPDPTPQPSPSQPGPSGSAVPPGGTIEATLADLVVRQRDVPNRFTVAPIPGGRSVAGGPTLDLCQGPYPSEKLRVGRLQVAAKDSQGATTLSTEAVQYDSDAATAQAFAEIRAATADCQWDLSMDLSQGTVTSSSITADIDRSWARTAGVDRLAYRVEQTEQLSGRDSSTVVVYLKRGPLFIGLYFPQPQGRQMPVEGRDRIPSIVKVFEKRLLNTPPGSGSAAQPPDGGGGVGA